MYAPTMILNFLPLEIAGEKFKSYVSNYESKESLRNLREKYTACVFSRQGHDVICVPTTGSEYFGTERELQVSDSPYVVCKLILDNLQKHLVFSGRKIVKLAPLSFIDTDHDLIKESTQSEKLHGLHIFPKFTIDVRPLKTKNGSTVFGVSIDVSAFFDISLSVKELNDKNIQLNGMYLDEKSTSQIKGIEWVHRHSIGRLNSIEDGEVKLTDYKNKETISSSECYPEARKDNFDNLLRSFLGMDYPALQLELQGKLQEIIGGKGKLNLTMSIVDEIKKITDRKISQELSFSTNSYLVLKSLSFASKRSTSSLSIQRDFTYCT